MDDTNLVASSLDGISAMLDVAQTFYNLNNTKINFSKAIFITNRDPHFPDSPLPPDPAPYSFNLHNSAFALTPLPFSASFHFLGVWFSLTSSHSFVLKQCRSEYVSFSGKLRRKRLTLEQLRYLHNSVLMPRVEYRLKTSALLESQCELVVRPFCNLFKTST